MAIYEKLIKVQTLLKAPKSQYNNFGKYNYRSCEDILEAVKPILEEVGLTLLITDTIEIIANRYYVKAECTVIDIEDGSNLKTTAYAREAEEKKGMDVAQVTGATSTYARKYALNGLFLIDDTKDDDFLNNGEQYKNTNETKSQQKNGEQYKNANETKSQQNKGLTEKQIKRLYAVAINCGFTIDHVKNSLKSYNKTNPKELTKEEYNELIDRIEKAGGVEK
ncbi:ERF superfamily protein [Peptostreptococcus russellii]|uniref:ERF superfamily protein n=1 Tax=Peptostreptococcus russellii TaxID=215200 RepID=A0A1H8KSN3_9FIRM|nr:ERF family protein [Peptostreptococcus russellii]SEN95428.1 ERF superfamily protein [Peptostreptococcus russellii]